MGYYLIIRFDSIRFAEFWLIRFDSWFEFQIFYRFDSIRFVECLIRPDSLFEKSWFVPPLLFTKLVKVFGNLPFEASFTHWLKSSYQLSNVSLDLSMGPDLYCFDSTQEIQLGYKISRSDKHMSLILKSKTFRYLRITKCQRWQENDRRPSLTISEIL